MNPTTSLAAPSLVAALGMFAFSPGQMPVPVVDKGGALRQGALERDIADYQRFFGALPEETTPGVYKKAAKSMMAQPDVTYSYLHGKRNSGLHARIIRDRGVTLRLLTRIDEVMEGDRWKSRAIRAELEFSNPFLKLEQIVSIGMDNPRRGSDIPMGIASYLTIKGGIELVRRVCEDARGDENIEEVGYETRYGRLTVRAALILGSMLIWETAGVEMRNAHMHSSGSKYPLQYSREDGILAFRDGSRGKPAEGQDLAIESHRRQFVELPAARVRVLYPNSSASEGGPEMMFRTERFRKIGFKRGAGGVLPEATEKKAGDTLMGRLLAEGAIKMVDEGRLGFFDPTLARK